MFGRELLFEEWIYYISWSIAAVLFVVAWLLLRGRPGRAFRAVRDSEVAAASSGIDPAAYKTLAFGISAFYAGVAGGLTRWRRRSSTRRRIRSRSRLTLLVGAVVAGLGSLWGILAGALVIQYLPDVAGRLSNEPGVPSVIYGLMLIGLMLVLPGGVAGLLRLAGRPLTSRRVQRS